MHTRLTARRCGPQIFLPTHSWTLHDRPLRACRVFLYHYCLQDASVDVKKWDKLEAKWSLMWHIMRIWCWTQESWLQRKHWLAHRSHQWVTWTFYPAPPIPSCHPHSPTAVLGDSRATQTFTHQGSQNERRWEPTGKPGGLLSLQTGLFFFKLNFLALPPHFAWKHYQLSSQLRKWKLKC